MNATPDYAPNWKPVNVFLPRVSPKERLTCVLCRGQFMRHEGAIGLLEYRGADYEVLFCWGCGGYEQNRKLSMSAVIEAVAGRPLGQLGAAP